MPDSLIPTHPYPADRIQPERVAKMVTNPGIDWALLALLLPVLLLLAIYWRCQTA